MESHQDNEREVVEAACGGDAEAMAGLYERYYAVMVWVAYSVLLDRGLAEDAAQQAFATACEKMHGLRRRDRFGPWLTRICRNAAIDIARERRHDAVLRRDAEGRMCPSPSCNGFDSAVKDAVDALAPMYREVVVLHYYNRMSYREIQGVLGISADTVKGRLARARKRMQAHLKCNGFNREQ
ncbi:MAG: sigma-70 family RNA polymerase sigma factor [Sedimentisphaerales bacterium]|nr:sigma-70 family RNA polymerase sigma factor [Sedimentisphaerales bacterium]